MSIFEWIVLVWLACLTIWLLVFKKGPKGDNGRDAVYYGLHSYDIKDPMIEVVSKDAEFMSILIRKINSLQINKGEEIN